MNENFLYRAKCIDSDRWVEGNLLIDTCGCFICADYCINNRKYKDGHYGYEIMEIRAFEIDPSTICRCTGVHDKNGKLIFENDIVDGHIKRGAAFYQCKVLWNECKVRFDVRAMDCNFPMTLDECGDDISICGLDYEVIGNIFDNPELLE